MAQPDYTQQLNEMWGWPQEVYAGYAPISIASNMVFGDNPAYSYTDFISTYPQFAGVQLAILGTSANSTLIVTGDISAKIKAGNYITGPGLVSGTTISSFTVADGNTTLTLSQAVSTAQPSGTSFSVVNAPTIPTAIVNAYIYLAVSSLFIARWGVAMWPLAIGLFVNHYVTLWAYAQTPAGASIQQIAAAGLAIGIDIGQHAGDVSYSVKPIELSLFGAWNLTLAGQELATLAQVIGSGSVLLW